MNSVYICEKPSLAAALAGVLGITGKGQGYYDVRNGGKVMWLRGHVLRLLEAAEYDPALKSWDLKQLPILPREFKKIPKAGDYGSIVLLAKNLLSQADEAVNVGDPDREGQLLVDEVLEYVGWDGPCRRLYINAMDDATISRALQETEDNRSEKCRALYRAAYARQQADWLIGINMSRKVSLEAGAKIRVGRVKSVIMGLVHRRNQEIDGFKPVTHYGAAALFRTPGGASFSAAWQIPEEILDGEGRLLDPEPAKVCAQQCSGKAGTVDSVETKRSSQAPPLPYSLSALQRDAGPKLGLTPAKVLELAQSLYEKKLTTYPRSDSSYLPESQYGDRTAIIGNLKGCSEPALAKLAAGCDPSLKSGAFATAKVEAHHALIPTMEQADLAKLGKDEAALYQLIARRYLLQFFPPYVFDATVALISCEGESFLAKGRAVVNAGWRAAAADEVPQEEAEDEEEGRLPSLEEGMRLEAASASVTEKLTKPPRPFTQDTLIGALTNAQKYVRDTSLRDKVKAIKGIGTEATRASVLAELVESGQLVEEGTGKRKRLAVSDAVKELMERLPAELAYPDMTALMEIELDRIAANQERPEDFISGQKEYVSQLVAQPLGLSKTGIPCPVCGKGVLRLRESKHGKFWSCSEYASGCTASFPDEKGKPGIHPCPVCKKGYLKRRQSKDGGYFWGCDGYKEGCQASFSDNKGLPVIQPCPGCGKGYLKRWKSKKGMDYYQCPACREFYDVGRNGLPQKRGAAAAKKRR